MSWTTPRTWVATDPLAASELNVDVRDNTGFLYTPPGCRVYNTAAISHTTTGAWQSLTFDSERYDTDAMHSTVSNTGRITFTTAGVYEVGGCISWAANATGIRAARVFLNGTTAIVQSNTAHNGTSTMEQPVGCHYKFVATDYVELQGFQSSGAALNMAASGNYAPEFWAHWQGAG